MARAKKMDRAEARRRYRAQLAAQAGTDEALPADDEPSNSRPAAAPRTETAKFDAPRGIPPLVVTKSPGAIGAFRGAYLPVHIREDLRLLPAVALRSPALIVPLLATLVAGVLLATDTGSGNVIVVTYISLLLWGGAAGASAMGGSFLAGLLAPRAGWLVGLLTSLFAWAVSFLALFARLAGPGDRNTLVAYFIQTLPLAILMGAFLGGFAAWYKRFLRLMSPKPAGAPQRRPSRPAPKPRPAARQR